MLVVGVLAGPTIAACAGDGGDLTACLRGKMLGTALLPKRAAELSPIDIEVSLPPAAPQVATTELTRQQTWIEAAAAALPEPLPNRVELSPAKAVEVEAEGRVAALAVIAPPAETLAALPPVPGLAQQPQAAPMNATTNLAVPPNLIVTGSLAKAAEPALAIELMPQRPVAIPGLHAQGDLGAAPVDHAIGALSPPRAQLDVETALPPIPAMRGEGSFAGPAPEELISATALAIKPRPAVASLIARPKPAPLVRVWGASPAFPSVTYLDAGQAAAVTALDPVSAAPSVTMLP